VRVKCYNVHMRLLSATCAAKDVSDIG